MTSPDPAPRHPICVAVEEVLAARGPLTEEQLADALRTSGIDLGPEYAGDAEAAVDDALGSDDLLVMPLADDRFAYLPTVLDGRVFSHRLSVVEATYDALDLVPDLLPPSALTESAAYQHLADGGVILDIIEGVDRDLTDARGIPDDEVPDTAWLLPVGCLAGLGAQAGDLVSVRATPTGWLVQRLAETDVPDVAPTALIDRLRSIVTKDDAPVLVVSAILQACADDPTAFTTPQPPMDALLAQAGLAREGEYVARAGFDFAAWRTASRTDHIAQIHGLDLDQAEAVAANLDIVHRVAAENAADADRIADADALVAAADTAPMAAAVRETLALLADPDVAEALAVEAMGFRDSGTPGLVAFAETMEPLAPRSARAALRWLRGKGLERLGLAAQAEACFDAAESLDPTWSPALFDLARYAGDRGDAERGLSLLRRAGASSDDNLVEMLEHFRAPERTDLGRNDRCWCGSGRKYKQCHQHREQLPLEDRVMWLYGKAGLHLSEGPWRHDLLELAETRSAYWPESDALLTALADPLVGDAMLFEGGVFADFIEQRGHLLPADELLLGQQWLLVERSLLEVEEVRPGSGMTVRDVRTGDHIDVRERSASRTVTSGQLLCARVVPAGDTMQFVGGIEPVELYQIDALIALLDSEPDPFELVAFLSGRFAPPTLVTTEGEPLMVCEATVAVPDADPVPALLDAAYERVADDDDGSATWHEYVDATGPRTIRATLRLRDDGIAVQTNSDARQDRVLARLAELVPGARVVSDERTPMAEAMAARPPSGGGSRSGLLDQSSPEVVALLDQLTREYEERWLDDHIPALAGLTPREAAADPTRRPDLIRLLATLDADADRPGTMSAARLRSTLGLT